MSDGEIAPAFELLRHPEFLESLTEAERLVLPYFAALWLRPEQRIPSHPWHYHGTICGRGWGKTYGVGCNINDRIAAGLLRPGEPAAIALMAPNDERVDEVQFATLIATAPPWCRPERYRDGLMWPNGVFAQAFTPEAPGRPRGGNFQLSWLTELVDWKPSTRREAFNNITTATRVATRQMPAQMLWDTTSQGLNENIAALMALNAKDPYAYPIQRGSMFDNPLLTPQYLRTEAAKYSGQRRDEEIRGLVYDRVEGALWQQAWLNAGRLWAPAARYDLRIVALDPALSTRDDADETGIIDAGLRDGTEIDVLQDLSGRHSAEAWGDIAVACCVAGAAGCVIERNRGGDPLVSVLRARAMARQLQVRELPDNDDKPFPRRTPGVMYVRQVVARDTKSTRATAPAAYTEQGHVHIIGDMPALERELTSYAPGSGQRSPNRYDAAVYAILELSGLERARNAMPPAIAAPDTAAAFAELQRQLRGLSRAVI